MAAGQQKEGKSKTDAKIDAGTPRAQRELTAGYGEGTIRDAMADGVTNIIGAAQNMVIGKAGTIGNCVETKKEQNTQDNQYEACPAPKGQGQSIKSQNAHQAERVQIW